MRVVVVTGEGRCVAVVVGIVDGGGGG